MGPLFLYPINMIKIIKRNGLLDADFIQPIVFFTVLIFIGEII